jgi:hypothetical protein
MHQPHLLFRQPPSQADFDEHERDLHELDRVRGYRRALPGDAAQREFLDARERDLRRRIRRWIDRFAR